MVITGAKTMLFFEANYHMAIPPPTLAQLRNEGITMINDLGEFDKDKLQQITNNLRGPGGRVPEPNYVPPNPMPVLSPVVLTVPTPPFIFGAKIQKRLQVACEIVRFFDTIGQPLMLTNVEWNTQMKKFGEQWKALKTRKEDDKAETPNISKDLLTIKWVATFRDHLCRCIGVRNIPLTYVVRPDVVVAALVPPLQPRQPFSELNGSIEEDLISRASHTHVLYHDENATVYYNMDEATRGTPFADSIKPFQRRKDGRIALEAM